MLEAAEWSGCVVTTAQASQGSIHKRHERGFRNKEHYIVEKRNPSLYNKAPQTECDGQWSCSGVILDRSLALVLCHGAIFFPFLKNNENAFSKNNLLAEDFESDLIIQVECPSLHGTSSDSKIKLDAEGLQQRPGLGLIPLSDEAGLPTHQLLYQAQLLMLVPCPEFQMAFSRLFSKAEGWEFSSEEEKHEYGELQKDLSYLHWFALLKLRSPLSDRHKKITFVPSSMLEKGCTVIACGSPFGSFYPDIFLNSISKGIISNTAGDRNVVLLTDARCLPGSEGGGIFAAERDRLCLVGIIVVPLCWKANEWVGLTVACSISHILENIIKSLSLTKALEENNIIATKVEGFCSSDLKRVHKLTKKQIASVVLVDSGQVWGSGVLVNPKVVLTCRHVVRNASRVTVKIRHPTSEMFQVLSGQVVFSTKESSPYDVAVVELKDSIPGIPEPVLASEYCTGMDVLIWGYGAFGESCGPSATSGVLSSVISIGDVPVMLQTSCAVHGGSSGGPVFSSHTGELLETSLHKSTLSCLKALRKADFK
uniref:Peroxisomal leader peptide-processing protease n=1 Tax=Xenopus tropicalis TaxID=8364 RepID=A0A803KF01_XENTR